MVNEDVLYGFRLWLFSWRPSLATSAPPVGTLGSTPRPLTAGADRSCAVGWRCCPSRARAL